MFIANWPAVNEVRPIVAKKVKLPLSFNLLKYNFVMFNQILQASSTRNT